MCGVGWAGSLFVFFFNDTATTEIYTLSLHDALPISPGARQLARGAAAGIHSDGSLQGTARPCGSHPARSEEHTSELQSRGHLVCRLLLEKKKKTNTSRTTEKNKTPKTYI